MLNKIRVIWQGGFAKNAFRHETHVEFVTKETKPLDSIVSQIRFNNTHEPHKIKTCLTVIKTCLTVI